MANDLCSKYIRYDAKLETSLVDEYLQQLNCIEYADEPSERSTSVVPIFIVGLPRTGTTLLEKIISTLSDIQAIKALNFRKCIENQLGIVCGSPFEIANKNFVHSLDFYELGKKYIEKTSWRANKHTFYTDKENTNFAYTGLIAKALPYAPIIHIRRNPMDACFSSYKQIFGSAIYPASRIQLKV